MGDTGYPAGDMGVGWKSDTIAGVVVPMGMTPAGALCLRAGVRMS